MWSCRNRLILLKRNTRSAEVCAHLLLDQAYKRCDLILISLLHIFSPLLIFTNAIFSSIFCVQFCCFHLIWFSICKENVKYHCFWVPDFLRRQNWVVGLMDLTLLAWFFQFVFGLWLKSEKLNYTEQVKKLYLKRNKFVVEVAKFFYTDQLFFFLSNRITVF